MPLSRRMLLQATTLFGLQIVALGRGIAGQLKPGFQTRDAAEALMITLGSAAMVASNQITLELPDEADLGAVVPITVSSSLPAVTSITIIAPANYSPLISTYRFSELAEPFISTRIKLAKSTRLLVVVKSNGFLYSVSQAIQVNKAGCWA